MLRLKRATVLNAGRRGAMEQRLSIGVDGKRRSAIADVGLVGAAQPGDEIDRQRRGGRTRLGSGGFDIVHINLTRGLDGEGTPRAHVMKLNYTSLQHAVAPSRRATPMRRPTRRGCRSRGPWRCSRCTASSPRWRGRSRRRARRAAGYVQTAGGALPGGHSCVVRELRETACSPATSPRARRSAAPTASDHDRRRAAPRPRPRSAGTRRSPGPAPASSARARRSATAAAGAGLRAHRAGARLPDAARARACPRRTCARAIAASATTRALCSTCCWRPSSSRSPRAHDVGDAARHEWRERAADLDGYARRLPSRSMGRKDPLFFAAALAAGTALAELGRPA